MGPASARTVKREKKPTSSIAALRRATITSPFDHLVGELLKMQRHVEAERPRGLEINRHLELTTPILRAACGCAHAASGHAAAPPIRPKNLASSHMTSLKEDQLRWWTF